MEACEWAEPCTQPPFIKRKPRKGRKAQGVRYERKVHDHFDAEFAPFYFPSPWLRFREEPTSPLRWCQPDALLVNPQRGLVTIIEAKYQHTADAWWQLRRLYFPVLRSAFGPGWVFAFCEVVRWYDPDVDFPEPVMLARCPSVVRPDAFGVHIFKP